MPVSDDLLVTPDGTIRAYDVLQILRNGDWLDYSTLRDQQEAVMAYRMVKKQVFYGNPVADYRIDSKDGFIT